MPKAYHIEAWDTLYETAETRKIRTLTYYAKPNKLVGEGIGYTLSQANAPHLLGMWALIEALGSTAPQGQRGWLVRNGTPLDAERMANLTRIASQHFEEALNFFSRPQVGWLQLKECPHVSAPSPGNPPEHPDTTGKPPGDSPGNPPEHPDTTGPISTRGKTDKRGKKGRERETLSQDVVLPTEEEVRAWARQTVLKVDERYALERFHATTERNGWVANGKLIDWRKRFERFWTEDREQWFSRKKAGAAGGAIADRPNGWKKGDEAWWWTGPIQDVESTLTGALLGENKKTAARLQEILKLRKSK